MKAIYKVPLFLAPQVFDNWLETPAIPVRTMDILIDKYSIVEQTEDEPVESLSDKE